jgi:hypothetical protein
MDSAVKLNKKAYKHAKELIQLDHVVLDERDAWSETPAGRAFKVTRIGLYPGCPPFRRSELNRIRWAFDASYPASWLGIGVT